MKLDLDLVCKGGAEQDCSLRYRVGSKKYLFGNVTIPPMFKGRLNEDWT